MKKVLMYTTAFAMTFAFASCGGNSDAANDENAEDSTEVVAEDEPAEMEEVTPEEDAMDEAEDMNDESMDEMEGDTTEVADDAEENEAPAE